MFSAQAGAPFRKKVTVRDVALKYAHNEKLTMVTAYTYPSAVHVCAAGIDLLLVGDSVAMVELGHDTTQPVDMEQMLHHSKAVARGATTPLLVGDMPFGSYEGSVERAYENAIRYLKEGGMDCVKLEGGRERIKTVRHLVDGGVAVMGHVGLMPQRISVLGGFRAQGKTVKAVRELILDAQALEAAGCFALVVECVPAKVAKLVTECLSIPTIGIGAGQFTSGQVLVYHDLLGMLEHAHHATVAPSFCKMYANVGEVIQNALNEYQQDVKGGVFPGDDFSPYKMLKAETDQWEDFREEILRDLGRPKEVAKPDEEEQIKLY